MQSARTRFQVLEETLKNPMNPLSPGDESLCLLLQKSGICLGLMAGARAVRLMDGCCWSPAKSQTSVIYLCVTRGHVQQGQSC